MERKVFFHVQILRQAPRLRRRLRGPGGTLLLRFCHPDDLRAHHLRLPANRHLRRDVRPHEGWPRRRGRDFIGTALLGTSIFFPGFLVSGFLTGYIYGWFFYRRRVTWLRACIPFFLVMIFIHLGLNTLWLTIFYHKAASAIFLSRLIKNLLCYPMEVGLFLMVYRPLLRFLPEQFPQAAAKKAATSTAA